MIPHYFENPAVKRLLDKSLKNHNKKLYNQLHDNTSFYLNGKKKGQHDIVEYLIEEKKERQKMDNDRGSLFFSIGLFLTMGFLIMAFEWNFSPKEQLVLTDNSVGNEEILDIPNTEQPPPPPPKKVIKFAQIVEIPDVEEIKEEFEADFDIEVSETDIVEEVEYTTVEEVEEEEVEQVFLVVEEQPEPEGGFDAFYKHVYESITYPPVAKRAGIDGRVFIQFVIEKDGKLSNVRAVKGIEQNCDAEAVRAVEECTIVWKPGKQRGKLVRTQMILPITYMLKDI